MMGTDDVGRVFIKDCVRQIGKFQDAAVSYHPQQEDTCASLTCAEFVLDNSGVTTSNVGANLSFESSSPNQRPLRGGDKSVKATKTHFQKSVTWE